MAALTSTYYDWHCLEPWGGPDLPPWAVWLSGPRGSEWEEGEWMGVMEKGIVVLKWPALEGNCGMWKRRYECCPQTPSRGGSALWVDRHC
jgi:hypothetical protein